jgi:signal transduction histidine kinase
MSDPHALRRIVRNLLSTSIKSALPGGQVIVSTVLDDSGDVLLRVDVVGDGIGAIEMTGAVAPPSQITTGTGLRSDKIGLGLLLTKALAEASHATLQIKRAPNEGRRVEIAFPSARLLAAQ